MSLFVSTFFTTTASNRWCFDAHQLPNRKKQFFKKKLEVAMHITWWTGVTMDPRLRASRLARRGGPPEISVAPDAKGGPGRTARGGWPRLGPGRLDSGVLLGLPSAGEMPTTLGWTLAGRPVGCGHLAMLLAGHGDDGSHVIGAAGVAQSMSIGAWMAP